MSAPAPPQRVRDWLLGQEALLRLLGSARSEDRLAHAYLFVGPRGCGKTRTALAFAQELLCQAPEGVSDAGAPSRSGARAGGKAPCGTCHGCVQVARLLHPDLHLVFPATREEAEDMSGRATLLERYAANRYHLLEHSPSASIGIDRIRALKEEVAKSGVEGDRRVVIISGAGRMTEQAAQSALKLIEEPPPDTVLILESESLAQLLPTLVSRCQRLRLRTLPVSELIAVLEKELGQEPAQARLLAALSGGSLGRALELKDAEVLQLRDRVLEAFEIDARLSAREVERRVQMLERARAVEQARRAGELLLVWYADVLAANAGLPPSALSNVDRAGEAARAGSALGAEEIGRRVRLVEEMISACEQNVNPALAMNVALTRMASRPGEEGYLL